MWYLGEACDLIAELQPAMRELGYHITLGGGVLNNGGSEKDLDLFIVPLNGYDSRPAAVLTVLIAHLGGEMRALRDSPDYHADANFHYRQAQIFTYCGKRIDVFIQ